MDWESGESRKRKRVVWFLGEGKEERTVDSNRG